MFGKKPMPDKAVSVALDLHEIDISVYSTESNIRKIRIVPVKPFQAQVGELVTFEIVGIERITIEGRA